MASLQTRTEESVFTKLSKLRNLCNNDIQVHQQKIDSYFLSFDEFLQSQKSKAQFNAENNVKLGKLKVELRKLEDEFVRALAVKTRKEAKRIALTESLSETKVKVDELQKIVRDQEARKDEYAAILAEQSKDLAEFEKKAQEAVKNREEIQEAFTWYNKALGFRIEGGHGVKFTFTNINKKIPAEEYSFTIRYSNDIYTLLDCNPHLNNLEHLIHELNKSNCLFRFVRIMREKFQAASSGSISHVINHDQDCTSISLSAPAPSVSTDSKSQSPLPLREINRDIEEANHKEEVCREVNSWASRATKGLIDMILSPEDLKQDSMLILGNALFFEAAWQYPFVCCQNRIFHHLTGETVEAPFMTKRSPCTFTGASFDDFKLVMMPYKRDQDKDDRLFAMYVFLPDDRYGLVSLLQRFS